MELIPSLGIPTNTKSLHEILGLDPQVPQVSFGLPVAGGPLIISNTSSLTAERSSPRFLSGQLRKGSEILVEALEREGVKHAFTSTGGKSMEIIHEALLNIIPIHKGGILAADGYARSSGLPGVYIASSGATDLVSGIKDAQLNSVPIVAIIGQETPVIEEARSLSKKNYLVLGVGDIPRVVREGFFVASSGCPGPVLIHLPEDIQQKFGVLSWYQSMGLARYTARLSKEPQEAHLEPIGRLNFDFSAWRQERIMQTFGDAIPPQYAVQVLDELMNGNAIISTGVGQYQMWAAQFYKYKYNGPRQWLTSGGLGLMGFGLPAAIGAAVARPDSVVVAIDDDGCFVMNVQELATIRDENLPVKIMVLNNQHLGSDPWEECFSCANGTYTYLGNPSNESQIFPDVLSFAEDYEIPAARVMNKDDLAAAIQEMLGTPGPYLLDVIVPHQEHVLPVEYPSGGAAIRDVITEGHGE